MRLCEKCRTVQKTCCEDKPRIILSRNDLDRIAAETGDLNFYELAYYPDLSFLRTYDYDPNWKHYSVLPGNLRRQLKTQSHGACVLLGPDGCRLSLNARPLMCRLYPYDYNESGLIGFCVGEDLACPVDLLEKGETLRHVFAATQEQIEAWRALYYAELRAEYEARTAAPAP